MLANIFIIFISLKKATGKTRSVWNWVLSSCYRGVYSLGVFGPLCPFAWCGLADTPGSCHIHAQQWTALFVLSFAEPWEHQRVPSTKASVNASVAPKAMASLPLQMEGPTSSYTSLSKLSGWPRKAGALVCLNYWMLLTHQIQEWLIICHPYLSKEELCRCYWQR